MRHLSVEEVWKLAEGIHSRMVDTSEFALLLDQSVWGEQAFSLGNFIPHLKRSIDAELSYPIIVVRHRIDNEYFVLDGMHRLAKHLAYGLKYISVIELPEDCNDIVVVGDQYEV